MAPFLIGIGFYINTAITGNRRINLAAVAAVLGIIVLKTTVGKSVGIDPIQTVNADLIGAVNINGERLVRIVLIRILLPRQRRRCHTQQPVIPVISQVTVSTTCPRPKEVTSSVKDFGSDAEDVLETELSFIRPPFHCFTPLSLHGYL